MRPWLYRWVGNTYKGLAKFLLRLESFYSGLLTLGVDVMLYLITGFLGLQKRVHGDANYHTSGMVMAIPRFSPVLGRFHIPHDRYNFPRIDMELR